MLNFNSNELKVEEELSKINKYLDLQKSKKNNLLHFLSNINLSIQDMADLNKLNNSVILLKNIKICIDTIRDIILNLEKLEEILTNFDQNQNLSSDIEKYNNLFMICEKDMYENEIKIQDLICKYIENSIFIPDKNINNDETNKETTVSTDSSIEITEKKLEADTEIKQEIPSNEKKNEPSNSTQSPDLNIQNEETQKNQTTPEVPDSLDTTPKLSDNPVLLISEKQNKVFLPYEIKDLENKLNENKKYKTLQEIIDKEYIIPYEKYKNPIIARFREAYCLMKNKEKASIFDSLDLALEVSFNSLLNPAVISACKNLNELDIYLDYLDTNELDKFKCFEIKYEMLPQKK